VQKHDRWRVVGPRSDPAVFEVLPEDFEPLVNSSQALAPR
jgi:hypothetical protein